jgi:hypothetical protein
MNLMPRRNPPSYVDLIGVVLAMLVLQGVGWITGYGSHLRWQVLTWAGYLPVVAFMIWTRRWSTQFWRVHTELAALSDALNAAIRALPDRAMLRSRSSDGQVVLLRRNRDWLGNVGLTRVWQSDAETLRDEVNDGGPGILASDEFLVGRMVLLRRNAFVTTRDDTGQFVPADTPPTSVWRRLQVAVWHLATGSLFAREPELREILAQLAHAERDQPGGSSG